MKPSAYKVSGKSFLVTSILILAAAILLALAFMEPKQTETGEWVPLNEAVETAIVSMETEGDGAVEEDTNVKDNGKQSTNAKDTDEKNTNEKNTDKKLSPEGKMEQLETPAEVVGKSTLQDAGKLDINLATAAELDELKGIGPSKAQAIIEDREKNGKYASVDDLLRVKGIGEKLLIGIEDSIVARQ